MMKEFFPYGKQSIGDSEIKAVLEVLQSDYITQGPKISEFESELAGYCGAKYAVVFNSGTAALHAAYFALGLEKDDELITSPNTFAATANAGLYLDAKPVFVDIESDTGNIDVQKLESAITEQTKLIVPVHYAGQPVDLKQIREIAKKHGLYVVEDACHALGAEYEDEKIGSCKYSDMTVFSFHPVKPITTAEGGAVVTNSEEFYNKLLMFRTHGITKDHIAAIKEDVGGWYYEMQYLGYNYRMSDIHAALGLSQLKKLDQFVDRRKAIVKQYLTAFLDNPYFDVLSEKSERSSSHHLFPILLNDKYLEHKRELFDLMRDIGLGVQVHYIPVYRQPYYVSLGYSKEDSPNTEVFYKKEISIPLYQDMTDEDVEKVCELLLQVFKDYESKL